MTTKTPETTSAKVSTTVPAKVKAPAAPRTVKASVTAKATPAKTVKVSVPATVKATKAAVRTSHATCEHETSGREGKIARAKCRREHQVAAAESAKAVAA